MDSDAKASPAGATLKGSEDAGAVKIAADKLAEWAAREGMYSDQACAARAKLFAMIDALASPETALKGSEALKIAARVLIAKAYSMNSDEDVEELADELTALESALDASPETALKAAPVEQEVVGWLFEPDFAQFPQKISSEPRKPLLRGDGSYTIMGYKPAVPLVRGRASPLGAPEGWTDEQIDALVLKHTSLEAVQGPAEPSWLADGGVVTRAELRALVRAASPEVPRE